VRRAPRPAGLRIATPRSRPHRPAKSPTTNSLCPQERLSLESMDLDTLLRLWSRRGGSSREFVDGSIELLHPNRERAHRGPPADVQAWLVAAMIRAPGLTPAAVNRLESLARG
jgi:hypothetical protein